MRTAARRATYAEKGGDQKVKNLIIHQKQWEDMSLEIVNDQFYKFCKVNHPITL